MNPREQNSHAGHDHIVKFYESTDELTSTVSAFVEESLSRREGVVLIATPEHISAFEKELLSKGYNVPALKLSRQLVFRDAAETLSKFLDGEALDPKKFTEVIGGLLDEVTQIHGAVNAYGEMVGILWDRGDSAGTVLLEQLWNDLAKERTFKLLCGYGIHQFSDSSHAAHFHHICQEHGQVQPAGQKGSEGLSESHYRAIAELKQRELALKTEIEERKKIEAALIAKQADLDDFFENASIGLHLVGPDGTILRANKAELELLGYMAEEYIGRNITEFHVDQKVIEEILHRLSTHQTLKDFPSELKCKDGTIKHVLIDSNVKWENGVFKHTRCFTRDVTDKKLSEENLLESQYRYQLLFDHSPLPKWIFNVETLRFVEVNLAALELYGYTKEEFLSLKATDIRPTEDVPNFLNSIAEASKQTNQILRHRFRHKKKNGSMLQTEVTALNLTLNGQLHRMGAVVDITHRVASEARQQDLLRSLRIAKEDAERANQLKSAFLANMSHEIRTPLGAMIGFADLLRDRCLSDTERTNYIDIVSRNGEQLSVIINDILDISKVEAGHLTLEYDEVRPEQIANEVLSLLSMKAKEKDLALDFKVDVSAPSVVVSDVTRVRQVLLNLVSNAIKFTQFGSVGIKIYGSLNEKNQSKLCFEVIDTGIGIKESHHERIFEVFVQADGSMTRRFGGTGLGLALSRKLARALGGDVSIIESKEHQGSRFLFAVEDQPERLLESPLTRLDLLQDELQITDDILLGKKVLVVDDAPDNQQLIWRYLTKYGAIVDSAENGYLGYRKALAGEHDIVLMDIQMPEMDGYTATQNLRDAGFRKPIIALTAHAMDEVRKKCLNIGCTDHLSKPINSKLLIQAVARYTRD